MDAFRSFDFAGYCREWYCFQDSPAITTITALFKELVRCWTCGTIPA
jgi:hypothetical protein